MAVIVAILFLLGIDLGIDIAQFWSVSSEGQFPGYFWENFSLTLKWDSRMRCMIPFFVVVIVLVFILQLWTLLCDSVTPGVVAAIL